MNILKAWLKNQRAVAAVEFALVVPVFLVIISGTVEIGRYVILLYKMESAAGILADVVSRPDTISAAEVDDTMTLVTKIMRPYNFADNGQSIVTASGQLPTQAARVFWQRSSSSQINQSSSIGSVNATPNLPGNLTLQEGETIISSEIFYQYTPIFLQEFIGGTVIHKISLRRTRVADLSSLD